MAVMGMSAEGCDIISPPRSGFQMLHEKSKMFRREVEWRQIRGRDGGLGLRKRAWRQRYSRVPGWSRRPGWDRQSRKG